MTATSTLEREEVTVCPKPPLAHVYCGACFETVRPQIALCGHRRPGSDTHRTLRPGYDLCVVCDSLERGGKFRCPTCGCRIRSRT